MRGRRALLALALATGPTGVGQARGFVVQRQAYVRDLRATLRAADPAADDAWFERALGAIGRLPREQFVPTAARAIAYGPTPLLIGYGQTISDGYIQAVMTAALRLPPRAHVLDVGTGSGYQAAILALLADRVASIEIVEPLARTAATRLRRLGLANVEVRTGDGFAGWPERAPFDGIVVAAGAAAVPPALIEQLRPGGRLVMPIGPTTAQEQLIVVTKGTDGSLTRCRLGWTMFVPLTGKGARAETSGGLMDRATPLCFHAPVS